MSQTAASVARPTPGTPGTPGTAGITGAAPILPGTPGSSARWIDRHYFLLRRLHSLSGIVPIGAFLVEHMITNAAILLPNGAEHYQKDVDFIWGLPGLLLLEIFGIWLPLAFHAGLGVVYAFTGRPNSGAYTYADNRRYTWMRITGFIALIYIFVHLAQTRWGWTFFGYYDAPFDPENATVTTAHSVQFAWWTLWFYLIGSLATIYHFANGLWTAAITWGLTLSVRGQRRWGYVCLALGIGLGLMAIGSIFKFYTYPLPGSGVEAMGGH